MATPTVDLIPPTILLLDWNKLPKDVRNLDDASEFKRRFGSLLLDVWIGQKAGIYDAV